MLVTFKSRAHADVIMFGEVALKLIKLMGRRETVPSAIRPEDIPRISEDCALRRKNRDETGEQH
jgi:hypothetical protein